MSLIKTNKEGRIRQSWAEKKSTKRLEKILYKLELNRLKLQRCASLLAGYGIIHEEALLLRNKYLYLLK